MKLSATSEEKRLKYLISLFIQRVFKIVFFAYTRGKTSLIFSHGLGFDEKLFLGNSHSILIGHFHSYCWVAPHGVRSSISLDLRVSFSKLEQFIDVADRVEPLVVQVRLGDYEDNKELLVADKDFFHKAIRSMWNNGTYKEIWLFSNQIVKAQSYVPIEFSEKIRTIDDPLLSPAQLLEIMRLGRGFVISNSTYGWWGAFFARTTDAPVSVPGRWFRTTPDPKKLVLEKWVRV
jgi:hypothetical protein